ncbi:aspartate aminotransferase family protein [Marinobacterium nitratireducens]|uniref:Aspartate aminotransferase family protein n=1 Tax=Marinobacterium nitratireducens TaxID=518897 RepID=A0A917ZMW1_9GAMM|nr:aminotransferase [Marinobacterium nitratireducens]GGO85432.1 aspartate aminotransferase family protein [Marinobacterium nitratireducens]
MTTEYHSSNQERDIAYVVHPHTNFDTHEKIGPHILERGEGVYVIDDKGNRYIEGVSGLWCTSLGFSEQRLVDAATKQMSTLPFCQTFAHRSNRPAIELAEKLIEIAPVPMSKVLFQCSGSEANDTAIKLAWYHHRARGHDRKVKIIGRDRGYHGTGAATASVTGLPYYHVDFNIPFEWVLHTDCPNHYRFAQAGESEEAFATRLASNLEDMILREGPENIAAFFAEPVMGVGGVVVPPATYFEKIQAVLKRHDILLIADEVICGFGRTGTMWGCQSQGIQPDLITCAKAMSAAYLPISAVLISETVYESMKEQTKKIGGFAHGYTYGGHPVCAAVALETIKIYEERNILGQVQESGAYLRERLEEFANHSLVGDIRGVGLMQAIELVRNKETREQFNINQQVAGFVSKSAQDDGVIIRPVTGDTLAFAPPLIISRSEIDLIIGATAAALDKTEKWVSEQG